jgi:hypothetical protein
VIYKDLGIERHINVGFISFSMIIIKDLMTLTQPIEKGRPLEFHQGYRRHRTDAGLYFLLPHNKDGSVQFTIEQREGVRHASTAFPNLHLRNIRFPDGYTPGSMKEDNGIVLKSYATKTILTGMEFFYEYTVDREGKIQSVELGYGPSRVDRFKSSFRVTEEGITAHLLSVGSYGIEEQGLVTKGSRSRELWAHKIDFEGTLGNLLKMMKDNEEDPDKKLDKLFTLDYVVLE